MAEPKRTVEVRLLVIAVVNLEASELADLLAASGGKPISVTEAISSEIASNLESVSYIEQVVVRPL